mgnify:CR=1 FL=1|tara:strand:- start:209 stop:397 length:189 start_codon:yes stop_codon:yes gene_type:complete
MKIDLDKVEVIEVDNIKHWDYPDYCDAFISEADYNGKPMNDEMLDWLNDSEYKYELVMEYIY